MKKRRQKTWISLSLITLSLLMFKPVIDEAVKTIELSQSLIEVEAQLKVLEAENADLSEQKAKLEDPEYVKSYARATYMLTKEGEQIYYLPKEGE